MTDTTLTLRTRGGITLTDGSNVMVPMMRQSGKRYHYLETNSFQALEMPYGALSNVAMVVFLPKKSDGLAELENSLSPEDLSEWLSRMANRRARVDLVFPKFRIGSGLRLIPALKAMGIKTAFSPGEADFYGMIKPEFRARLFGPLYISRFLQEAWIEVSEEGTEAAAAAAVVYVQAGIRGKPIVFRADHPFMFIIMHKPTNCILFMGRVMDPRSAKN